MKHYTDLFIDFDDTLYDTHGGAIISLREVFDEFQLGRHFPDAQVFYDAYWEANIDLWTRYARNEITRDYLIVERFHRPLSVAPTLQPTKEFCLQMSDRFLDLCASKPYVVEGAHELMEHLASCDYRMHMCSNGFHEVQSRKLASCGLGRYFTKVILSEDAGANKPSPRFFDYAFKVSGAKPETTLMIGDNYQTDILGAANAGLDTLFFNRFPEWQPAANDYQPTMYVTSLKEIIGLLAH